MHPSLPAKNLKEFIAYAKANQDKLSYGSAGAGTMTHLAGELFKHLIGAPKIVHVPYKGAGPSITDLVGGAIPMCDHQRHRPAAGSCTIPARSASSRSPSPDRLKGAPDIPTAVEAGLPE